MSGPDFDLVLQSALAYARQIGLPVMPVRWITGSGTGIVRAIASIFTRGGPQ